MKDITTASGFSATINELIFDDLELFDNLCALENRDYSVLRKTVERILGSDAKRLYDHVRTEDGRVPVTAVCSEIVEIVQLTAKK